MDTDVEVWVVVADVRLKEKGTPALEAIPISCPAFWLDADVRLRLMLVKLKLSPVTSFMPGRRPIPATLSLDDDCCCCCCGGCC